MNARMRQEAAAAYLARCARAEPERRESRLLRAAVALLIAAGVGLIGFALLGAF